MQKLSRSVIFATLACFLLAPSVLSATAPTATYLGNEGVMVSAAEHKILFDPFFHNDYGQYQKVPDALREALFSGKAPYDNIAAIFISHAHGDHFDAGDIQRFLRQFPNTHIVAPQQAIAQLSLANAATNIHALALDVGDAPIVFELGDIRVHAVRIPHAGWPQRATISNLVYRVQLGEGAVVMHMGDADPNDAHFKPLAEHWQALRTHSNFPPYWFFLSDSGQFILNSRLNAAQHIGVHVPVTVPQSLAESGAAFFHQPGEQKTLVPHRH